MPLRRRRQRDHPDDLSATTGTTTQWQNGVGQATRAGSKIAATNGQELTSAAEPRPDNVRPRPKPPITRALLNKPLPPLPPEAFENIPAEKPPIKPVPDLANHPALRAQTRGGPARHAQVTGLTQRAYGEHVKEPSGLNISTVDSSQSTRQDSIVVSQKTRKHSTQEDTATTSSRPEMIDQGTQTTPSLEFRRSAAATVKSRSGEVIPARPATGKARLRRKSSDDDGRRTPLWSPRTILRQSVDYFSCNFPEDDADTEDNIESQFKKYLGRLANITPPSTVTRKGRPTAISRSSSGDREHVETPSVPRRPGILRSAKSEDQSNATIKAVRYEESEPRTHPSKPDSAPAVLTISGKSPGSPATRPLPLPLQKLTSLSQGPLLRRRMSHHSDSGSSHGASPLRQEVRRHSHTPPLLSPNNVQPAVQSAMQPAAQVAAPISFKMNRPRIVKVPARDHPMTTSRSPINPQEAEEAAELFFTRTPFLIDEPDEFGIRLRAEPNVPEHLAGSPLCPMHPKHKSGGLGVCPYHGRRKSAEESTASEGRRSSECSTNKSLQSSRHDSPRRSSIVPSEPIAPRRASVESQDGYDRNRRSALNDDELDAKRQPVSDPNHEYRPSLGRQTSWGAAIDDGAVRGFGFSPSPPRSKPSTPATPASSAPVELSRNKSVIHNTVVKHLQINDDETNGPSHATHTHEEQRLRSAEHSPYPSPQATEVIEEPITPPAKAESRATRNASSRRGRPQPVKPAAIERGDRIGIVMDSSDSIYRVGRYYGSAGRAAESF